MKVADAVTPVVPAVGTDVKMLDVLVTGEASVTPADVLVAAGNLSTGRNSADEVFVSGLTVTPADILPTAVVWMLVSSGSSCGRPSGGL